MRRLPTLVLLALLACASVLIADQQTAPAARPATMALTIDSIMRGPALIGSSPSNVRWSKDSTKIYFSWQKAGAEQSATFEVNRDGTGLREMTPQEVSAIETPRTGRPDQTGRRLLTTEGGDIVIYDATSEARRQLTRTSANESDPRWVNNDTAITFQRDGNLYLMALEATAEPQLVQLTDIVAAGTAATGGGGPGGRGAAQGARAGGAGRGGGQAGETEAQRLLREQELQLIEFLRNRQQGAAGRGGGGRGGGRGGARGGGGGAAGQAPIARFQLAERQSVSAMQLAGDGRYVYIFITEQPEVPARGQDTPNYITASSYPEMIPGRPNVGDNLSVRKLAILDTQQNRHVWADASSFAGTDYTAIPNATPTPRTVNWGSVDVSPNGAHTIVTLSAQDNKNRWMVRINPETGAATPVDTLRDDAWVRNMGISGVAGGGLAWLPDNNRFLFMSEKSGYMHVYSLDMSAAQPEAVALTTGNWEVTGAQLSADRTRLFLTTNEVHPGERHFYTMSVNGGERTKVTSMVGSNDVTLSPDEQHIALIHSYTIKPPELHVMPMTPGAEAPQVTTTPSDEWRAHKWIDPQVITYKARDGQDVYARLYTPEMMGARRDPRRPAVVFVHGAGYLQNAHKYWSTYYREMMFHNILASKGYVVLDPDFRASSGYGRDWRTGIYRHMGGKDLEDVVDGARFLVQNHRVNAANIGVYGGSYGGFITLMAMFTTPDVFAAGAALRPVTDWSHYNHGYTSNILNTPANDPEAYRRSSPIFFAEGLKGRLLMLHGMVDTNVFYQDSVRLAQRLIELRKENWDLVGYPVENHGFTEETSWADEYKRILKMYEEELRGQR